MGMTNDEKPLIDNEIVTLASGRATGEPLPEQIPGGFENPVPANHYKDENGNYVALPEGTSYGDWMLKPGKPLSARHKKVAELIAQGKSTTEIAEALGYTMARISVLRSNTQIAQEADRFRDRLFDKTIGESLQQLGPDAVSTVEEVLRSDTEKLSTRVDTARWLIEKLTGKPRQEVEVGAGTSLLQLLQKLDQLKMAPEGTPERDVLEMTKGKTQEADWMESWVSQNIPGVENEKTEGGKNE